MSDRIGVTQLYLSCVKIFFIENICSCIFLCIIKVSYCCWVHGRHFRIERIFFSPLCLQVGSYDVLPPLNYICAKVLLASIYTEAGATGLHLFSDFPPVTQTTAAETWGQLFCFVLFPFVFTPPSTVGKRGILFSSHAGKAAVFPQ